MRHLRDSDAAYKLAIFFFLPSLTVSKPFIYLFAGWLVAMYGVDPIMHPSRDLQSTEYQIVLLKLLLRYG
jgi:hypothetical protein